MRNILALLIVLSSMICRSQTVLTDQNFDIAPSGWTSTASRWDLSINAGPINSYSPSKSAKLLTTPSMATTYLYIPVDFKAGYTYTASFWTKNACLITVLANESADQNTPFSNNTYSPSSCMSWSNVKDTFTSYSDTSGFIQIGIMSSNGNAYLDDLKITEITPDALPIELLYFDAEPEEDFVSLKWATASEHNNDYFSVERSINGIYFEKILKIIGAGNSTHLIEYSTFDKYPVQGMQYYRLRQTDYDGKSSESTLESVYFSGRIYEYVRPNPFGEKIFISFEGMKEVSISDMMGRSIFYKLIELDKGCEYVIETSHLNPGPYIVRIGENRFLLRK